MTSTKAKPDSQYKNEEGRRVPAVRAQRGCADRAVGLSQAKFAQARSRDAPTLPGSGPGATLGSQSLDTHLPLNPGKQRVRGAQHLSLCAKGVSRRLYCRDPHGERAPATCQVPWRSILPTAETDPHGPREPIHLQSGEWKCPGKGLGVHTGCKPPGESGVRWGRKES